MEIANLSHAGFKTMVTKMLRELVEYGKHIREEVKAILSEIKKNLQGTNSEGKEARVQIDDGEHKGDINGQPVQNEKQEFKKQEENKKVLRHLQMCQHPNHRDATGRRGRT